MKSKFQIFPPTRLFVTIQSKLVFAFMVLSLIPFLAIGILSFITSSKSISSLAFEQLNSVREAKRVQVENFFEEQQKDLGFLIDAVKSMKQAAFQRLNTVQNKKKSELTQYFRNCISDIRVLTASGTLRDAITDFSSITNHNDSFEQSLYNFFEDVKYSDLLSQFRENYKYYDLMLINHEGTVVFSIKKESDLGENIFNNSALMNSSLVNCFSKSIRSSNISSFNRHSVIMQDFQKYEPSEGRHIVFLSAPIFESNGMPVGIVVLKIDKNAVNTIVQNRQDMGKNGETYLIGDANGITTYKSDQVVKSGRIGQKADDIDIKRKININKQPNGKNTKSFGPVIENSINGKIEITRYDILDIPGLEWIIVTSMSLEEEIAPALSKKDDYFSKYAKVYGFSDILLISAKGDMFYSAFDAQEYGTNLVDGPFTETGTAKLFNKISSSGNFEFVGFSSSYNIYGYETSFPDSFSANPFAFIGKPLIDDNGKVEIIVVLKISLSMIDQIMKQKTGMSRTGSIYLVGTDGFSRSSLPKFTGTSNTYESLNNNESVDSESILLIRRVKSESVTNALSGISGNKMITDYRGVEVLSSYAPLNIFNTRWGIIAEIDKKEAFAGLTTLKRNALFIALFSFCFIVLISVLIARHFAKPIAQLTESVHQLKARNFDTTVNIRTNDELESLAQAFNDMASEVKKYSLELECKASEIKQYSDALELKMDILKKTEEELRNINNLLTAVMNGTTDAIFLKDIDGRHLVANTSACKALGTTIENLIGKSSQEFLTTESAANVEYFDNLIIKSGRHIISELEIPLPEIGSQWWLTNKSPYYDSDGNVIGIIGIGHNITEHKIAEQEKKMLETQLRQSQKMEAIGTLAAGVAHDFNNILSAIQGYSEMVMYELPDFSSEKMSMEKVLYACHRAKQLIRQILAFSRTSPEECLVPLNIHDILEETIQLIRASTPATIEILTDISHNCGAVLGDSTQLHQIIMNLCTNAAYSMDEKGGVMTVSLNVDKLTKADLDMPYITSRNCLNGESIKPGKYIVMSVHDTGSGIAPENIDRIFDPYFTTKPTGKGSGMGLAVAQGIVQKNGGIITVESTPEKGTTFKVWLPQIQNKNEIDDNDNNFFQNQQDATSQASDSSNFCISNSSKFTTEGEHTGGGSFNITGIYYNNDLPRGTEQILIVDDEPDLIEITTHRLESLGYTVTGMTSSPDALIMFEAMSDKFDLIITDQTMPKLTGAELVKKIIEIRQDMPVILCTGYSTKVDETKAENIGVREFLLKPVDYRELAFAVRRVLNGFSSKSNR
ncbi:MAG: response regulator [Desulfamplus sp.]|nr:response regulator [Desulfamplus sp.]